MSKRLFLQLLPGFLALVLLAWVIRVVPLAETWAVLRHLRLWQIGTLALVNGVVLLTLNGRWWFILRGLGYRLPYLRLTAHRLAAFGVSYFTPGPQFGGEPVQVILVEREHGVPQTAALTAVVLDKMLELLVNFMFLLAGILVILQEQLFKVGAETAVIPLLLLLFPAVFLMAAWQGRRPVSRLWLFGQRLPLWRWQPGWRQVYDKAGTAVRASESQITQFCQKRPLPLLWALLASLVSWLALIGEYWLMLSFLSEPVTIGQTIMVMTAARIAFLLPLPGGLGALEISQLLAFTALGLNPAAGISIGLLIRARDMILGGAGLFWGGKRWRSAAALAASGASR